MMIGAKMQYKIIYKDKKFYAKYIRTRNTNAGFAHS